MAAPRANGLMIGRLFFFFALPAFIIAWQVSRPLSILLYAGMAAALAFVWVVYRKR